MTSPIVSLSLIIVALAMGCFTLPIIEPQTSTSFPVNLVEGHLPRGFNNEFDMFTSTLVTPLFQDTTAVLQRLSKKDNGADDQGEKNNSEITNSPMEDDSNNAQAERNVEDLKILQLTTSQNEGQLNLARVARNFNEKNKSEMTNNGMEEDSDNSHAERNFEEKNNLEMTTNRMGENFDNAHAERNLGEKILEMTTIDNEGQSNGVLIDRKARKFEEAKTLEPEVVSTDKLLVKVQTTVEKVTDIPQEENDKSSTSTSIPRSSSSSSTTPAAELAEKFVGHAEDVDRKDKKKPKPAKKPIKESDEDKEEKEKESDEATTEHSSAARAEFVPNLLDSISTPPGNLLRFDENRQSIPHHSADKDKDKDGEETVTAVLKETLETSTPKIVPKKTIVQRVSPDRSSGIKLNQGEESAIPEEKESNH